MKSVYCMWNDILTHAFAVADGAFAFSGTIAAGAALVTEYLFAVLVDARLAYGAFAAATPASGHTCTTAVSAFDWSTLKGRGIVFVRSRLMRRRRRLVCGCVG